MHIGDRGLKRRRRFDAVASAAQDNRPDARTARSNTRRAAHIQHNLRDLHTRNASTASCCCCADRRRDRFARIHVAPGRMTVEHVLPRAQQSSPWREWFPDPDVREQCTESLGNPAGDQGAERSGQQ
jgi:hypothetical protein